jgi:hypothetical protein
VCVLLGLIFFFFVVDEVFELVLTQVLKAKLMVLVRLSRSFSRIWGSQRG